MDEEIERLVVSVRADTSAFARDVASMRGELEGPLVAGAGRAGSLIDRSLAKAILSGKSGFDARRYSWRFARARPHRDLKKPNLLNRFSEQWKDD